MIYSVASITASGSIFVTGLDSNAPDRVDASGVVSLPIRDSFGN
jgi:hypothetical protein